MKKGNESLRDTSLNLINGKLMMNGVQCQLRGKAIVQLSWPQICISLEEILKLLIN
jgi:hypothetical protein